MKQKFIRFLEKKFYKGFSLMLTVAMVFTMIPTFVIPAQAEDSVPSYIFDISNGDITIAAGSTENTVKVTYGTPNVTTDEFNNTQEITITGTTTANKVVVATGVTTKITLDNADIQPSNGCAFDIQGDSNVELALAEGTTNTLKSSGSFAGLQVQEKDGNAATVTIQGTGTLNAIGGGHGLPSGTGAGIGGGGNGKGGNITINNGTVIAKGGGNGAGIGGGNNGAGGNITISGGTVTAINTTGGVQGGAAAIGGGWHAPSGNITISGGTVTAESTWEGAAIGGGERVCDNITISGGTVVASSGAGAGIGSGIGSAGGTIAISGNANVTAIGMWGGAGIGGGKSSGNGGTIKIDNTATVIAVSDGTKNAISDSDNAIEAEGGTVANVLMANYLVPVKTETKVKNGSGDDLTPPISYVPVGYKSIAFTVPSTGDYMIYNGGVKQQGNNGVTISSTFSVEAGLNTFLSVTEVVGEVAVTAISVNGTGAATEITTNGGTLQMEAVITPGDATNKEVTWSVENGTGSGTISATGMLTAIKNGTVTVKATAKDGSLVFGSKEITISGQGMTGTVTIEGTAKFGQTLTATPSITNGGTVTYQWNRNGVAISGATSSTYTLKEDDIGKTITVTATAEGSAGTGSITSEATVAIAKADAPSAPLAPVMVSKTHTSVTLGANVLHQFSKDNGVTWQDSEVFTGLNPSTAYTFVARVKGTSTTNESVAGTGTSVTTDVAPIPGMTGTVTIEGTAKFGQTLTATPSLANGGTVTYQWSCNGVAISGATSSTYTLKEDDIGKTITVTATADGISATGAITSEATVAIAKADAPSAPDSPIMASKTDTSVTLTVNDLYEYSKDNGATWQDSGVFTGLTQSTEYTFVARVKATSTTNESVSSVGIKITTEKTMMTGTVTIEGTAKFGQTLTATPSLANGGTVTYQWSCNGVAISGATSSTYTLKEDDIGKTITVTATADGISATGAITSEATVAIAKADAPSAPLAPVMASKTHISVTLGANVLHQFSKDNGVTWQDSEVFTGLSPSTVYTFVARVKGTSTTNESVAGTGTSITTGATPYVPPTPTEREPRPEPRPESRPESRANTDNKKEQIIVNINDGKSDKLVSEITIERETAKDGTKKDTVKYEENKAKETVGKLKEDGKDTARIVISDKKDEITETKVDIPKNTLNVLGEGSISLEISTENARINLPKETIKDLSKEAIGNLYFRVVPIKKEEQKNEVTERVKHSSVVMQVAGDNNISVVARPMIIETNMSQNPVDIMLPLKDVVIPTDPREREEFLKKLSVYIEHGDGEKELIKGGIVEYKDGVLGIKFRITKFSTFTIIKIDTPTKSNACEVTNWTKPTQLAVNGTTVTKAVDNEVTSITVEVSVSDKATYKLYSDETCTKDITDKIMRLNVGENEAYIKVTAEDGTQKIYKVRINRAKVSDIKNVPQITFVGLEHSPICVGETQSFYITSKSDNKVQYRIFLYNDTKKTKEELTNGYTELVSPDFPYVIRPNHKFTLGKYRAEIWVKQEGSNKEYDSTYTAYLNCVNKDDKNRVYTNGDLMIEKDTYTVGEKVVISGIKDIGGITGPYYYRLHILRPDQIGKDGENSNGWYYYVTDYKSAIEWTPQEPGTYILDVQVITPNSIIWKNKDRKSKLIYGTYEGWKLKTIIVNEKPINNDPVNKE